MLLPLLWCRRLGGGDEVCTVSVRETRDESVTKGSR